DQRVVVTLLAVTEAAHLQVRLEVVRVDVQRETELPRSRLLVAVAEQRAAVQGVRARQLRVQLHGAGQLRHRGLVVLLVQEREAHEQVYFPRVLYSVDTL